MQLKDLPNGHLKILNEGLAATNDLMNCYRPVDDINSVLQTGELMKLQTKIRHVARLCRQTLSYKRHEARIDALATALKDKFRSTPALAMAVTVHEFIDKMAEAPAEADALPLILYYFPILDNTMQHCIDDLTNYDFNLPV